LWDDEHNGAADVGTTIRTIGANKYHQPWRSTAWEIHPAIKLEALEAASAVPAATVASPTATPTPPAKSPPPSVATPQPQRQFVTVIQPVKIKIPYGETVIPRGTRLPIVSQDANTVTVSYLDGTYAIPITSTDLR
jgi:hypothetical protein